MTIIPAIDIIDGKCVRLTKGDYAQKTIYNEDPLEAALQFEGAGLKRLHLVDLDGAKAGDVKNWKVLEKIAVKTKLAIDFSGGISTQKNLEITFNSGSAYASIGSMAVKDEFTFSGWLMAFGAERFIIGADVKDGKVVIKGWTESTPLTVFELIEKYKLKGVRQFFCTDVNKDGLLEGPATLLYKKIMNEHPSIDLIASGGIATIKELDELREAGCTGAIIGKAIYENRISLADLSKYL
ncbi:MAG: 1-(5-phosphoribosyl)-5-[(5-phosphoribosylamino)methylideneamino]imidazole-4-carboxamide isomerase [Chitinophagaceae bacterium]|nr:1-(5-phosphoribosyl)-5-[(5-phosphoribosylamino)methylideneamino]imidazole-4-carboxamide isomerase [Chitinophagaceae bacterium]